MSLSSNGVNPMNYISIPDRFRSKYRSKTYGANYSNASMITPEASSVTVVTNNNDDFSMTAEGYQPVPLENISRTYIDSVEVSE